MIIANLLLSRIQFAFTISFHILFPSFSIGLALFLAIMEGFWIKTKNEVYLHICQFWTQIFALTFGMGIVSGVVMEFQLGTNWANFTHVVGSALGPLFTYEVMTAFFIEAGFLGVMLFGWKKVSPGLHYLSTLLVTLGTTLSAYWIMTANSWMQHPVGFILKNNVFHIIDWSAILFNSHSFARFLHMLIASYIAASFVIISVTSFYLLRKKHVEFAKTCVLFAWSSLLLLTPLQIVLGDIVGVIVSEQQPIKTAAIEAIWETQKGAPFVVFALPNEKQERNDFAISIPHIAALLNTHHWSGNLIGLKSVAPEDRPPVFPVFYSFRIMVALGFLMLAFAIIAFYLRNKQQLENPFFLKLSMLAAPLGFIALWSGWITAEIGRQPWVIYNVLRTKDAVSPVPVQDVVISLSLMIIVYGIIFGYFYFYFLLKLIKKGPQNLSTFKEHQPFQYMPSGSPSHPTSIQEN